MNRIEKLFQTKDKNVLNIYFTAGYPGVNDTEEIILSLEKAGVDLVEVGMPYSDPLADGPTIQESGTAALENGMTLPLLFEQLAAVRKKTEMPMIMMGYFNQVMQYGERAFFEKAAEVGVDGLILPDLPLFEYETYFKDIVESLGLAVSFLITPQTEPERIRKIDELTHGFIYIVSSSSITGAKSDITDTQLAYFNRINDMQLKNKCLIGFGISNHETFATACQYANGAIIGSAYIKALTHNPNVAESSAKFVEMVLG